MDLEPIRDAELLDYLAGRLDQAGRARVQGLAPDSPQARRLEELSRTWNAIGAWRVDVSGVDIRQDVARLVQRPGRNFVVGLDWWQIGRIAATWLLAMTLGAVAGRGVARHQFDARNTGDQARVELATPPSDEALANALQLDLLSDAQAGDAMQAVIEGNSEEVGG